MAATLDVGAGVRSALVRDGDDVLAVTRDGVLHRISMAGGRLTEVGKVKFADSSTSTPTVAGGLVYVGGAQLDGAGPKANGVLAVIDPAAMTVVHRVTRAAGTAIPGKRERGRRAPSPIYAPPGRSRVSALRAAATGSRPDPPAPRRP